LSNRATMDYKFSISQCYLSHPRLNVAQVIPAL